MHKFSFDYQRFFLIKYNLSNLLYMIVIGYQNKRLYNIVILYVFGTNLVDFVEEFVYTQNQYKLFNNANGSLAWH